MVKCALAVIALISVNDMETLAQETVQGYVYEDVNQNHRREKREKGIPEVAVSNGRDVVATDHQGHYQLPVRDGDMVFVIKPTAYDLPVDEQHLPQFYYAYKPNGSPPQKYEGSPPTGTLSPEVDFGLIPAVAQDTFSILVFGDPQPNSEEEVTYFDQDVVEGLANSPHYAFGISLGDIVNNHLELYPSYRQAIARVGIPWFHVIGNHDMNFDAEEDRYADETFEAVFGPATYSFNEGEVHFVSLDDVVYPRPDGQKGYIGGFTNDQFTFLENDLKQVPRNHLVVLSFHIPILREEQGGGNAFREEDAQRFFELLRDFEHVLVLSAHTHKQKLSFRENDRFADGPPHFYYNVGTTCGDWWSGVPDSTGVPDALMRDGTPNGYAILRFEGNQFVIDYRVARSPEAHTMNVWGPRVVMQKSWPGANLYVNYFLGSDSTKVTYRVGDQSWQPMRKVEEADPFVSQLRDQWDTAEEPLARKRPHNPKPSSHLWIGNVPDNLPVGEHTIQVRVQDVFGRTFREEYTYEVIAANAKLK